MRQRECVAMILAGGRGKRLGALTRYHSKPAVFFGGNHRIIDFTLSNCVNSGIDTIGILSQYLADDLHAYINSIGSLKNDMDGLYMRPSCDNDSLYSGTADAVYQNIGFIEELNPSHVLILSGDHIYKMDYRKMLDFHKKSRADVTIASASVPWEETSKYGILSADDSRLIYGFAEKPQVANSTLASMGVYIFRWEPLRKYLMLDKLDAASHHDFGKNIIPNMLNAGECLYTYRFGGYWRDVGTVDSLWQSNMDILHYSSMFDPMSADWEIRTSERDDAVSYISNKSTVYKSRISGSSTVRGDVLRSVVSTSVVIREGAQVSDSVIMPHAYIGKKARIHKAVIGSYAQIMDGVEIGVDEGSDLLVDRRICARGVSLVAPWLRVCEGLKFRMSSNIDVMESNSSFVETEHSKMERYVPVQEPKFRKRAENI